MSNGEGRVSKAGRAEIKSHHEDTKNTKFTVETSTELTGLTKFNGRCFGALGQRRPTFLKQ